jgi:uncharacterized protein
VSSFDDEFGLFGDEVESEEERRPTLGARRIASGETVIDEIEPEDEGAPRRQRPGGGIGSRPHRRHGGSDRPPLAPEIAHPRAAELLEFLAKGLVSKPEAVVVEIRPDARGAVIELEVDPDDLGKVIGRSGRVAQALRTIVRAGAEGRVKIDILDAEEEEEDGETDDSDSEDGDEQTGAIADAG